MGEGLTILNDRKVLYDTNSDDDGVVENSDDAVENSDDVVKNSDDVVKNSETMINLEQKKKRLPVIYREGKKKQQKVF